MKNYLFCLLLTLAANTLLAQVDLAFRMDFAPPLQNAYLIPIHSVTAAGDTLMSAPDFYKSLQETGIKQRSFRDEQTILGMPTGITYMAAKGTPVFAVAAGKIHHTREDALRNGFWLQVKHEKQLKSEYIALTNLQVKIGEKIQKGQLLGYTTMEDFHFQFRWKDEPIEVPVHFYQKDKIVARAF